MKNAVIWALERADYSEERIVSIIRLIVFRCRVLWLLVTTNIVPSSPIFVTLMMDAICSSQTSVTTRATRRNIQEDGIL
jgi:hypothetical protein